MIKIFFPNYEVREQPQQIICSVRSRLVVHNLTVSRWYWHFRYRDISFEEEPRSGRKSSADDEELRALIKVKPNTSSRELEPEPPPKLPVKCRKFYSVVGRTLRENSFTNFCKPTP